MAILPYGEVKLEIRRAPKAIYKVLEIAANQALETNYFNLIGTSQNPVIKFTPQNQLVKKIRDFFMKNTVFRSFLKDMDKREERVFMNEIQAQQFNSGDRVIRRDTKDRALFIVLEGEFFAFDADPGAHAKIYKAGSVIGVD